MCGIPHQLLPVFLVSEIDQLTCVPYIDAVESFGLPSDTCPVPSSECGALVIDALPDMGCGFISSSMPCDGSTMASSYYCTPLPEHHPYSISASPFVTWRTSPSCSMAAEDIRGLHKVHRGSAPVQNGTGTLTSPLMKRFNQETAYELEKWES